MARRFLSTVVVAVLLAATVAATAVFALTGCGTLSNLQEKPSMFFPRNDDAPPNRIYGGVRISAEQGWHGLKGGAEPVAGTYRWVVDVPLSAVADTLTLPVTIPAALERAATPRESLKQRSAQSPPAGLELVPAGVRGGTTEGPDDAETRRKKNP
jgi:uncharacterized protein YceK